jgi:hypothetical protein
MTIDVLDERWEVYRRSGRVKARSAEQSLTARD